MKPRFDVQDFAGVRPRFVMCLLHGADADLVEERTTELTRLVAGSLDDPFRVSTLAIEDHSRLLTELTAGSLSGGRRVVRVRDSGDRLLPLLQRAASQPGGDTLVILEAGLLTRRSKLRSWAEADAKVAAIQCNSDDLAQRRSFIALTLKRMGQSAPGDLLDLLADRLSPGRRGIEGEIAKLVLLSQDGPISWDDAHALFDSGSSTSVQAAIDAALAAEMATALVEWERAHEAGANGVGTVRILAGELGRVLAMRADIDAGTPAQAALERQRIYGRDPRARLWRKIVQRWTAASVHHAYAHVRWAETACKTTGANEKLVVAELLTRLANAETRLGQQLQ